MPIKQTLSALMIFGAISACHSTPAVQQAVKNYAAAGDERDTGSLDKVLHDQFRVVFAIKGKPQVTLLSRDQYIGLLKAGKIGGQARKVKILSVQEKENIATVKAELTTDDSVFHAVYTLIKGGTGWQLIQDSVLLEKK